MDNKSRISAMRRIIEYTEAYHNDGIDLWKAKYLFERYEKTADTDDSDGELSAMIEHFTVKSDNSERALKLFYYSFLLRITEKPLYIEKLLKMCINGEIEDPFEINFVRWRCLVASFKNHALGSAEGEELSTIAYGKCFEGFCKAFEQSISFIPKNERNKKLAYVFTSQYLDLSHAPTKTMLARCLALKNVFGMEVRIINTREHLSIVGKQAWYKLTKGSVVEEYNALERVEFRGVEFDFYQCPTAMPEINEIDSILKLILLRKPYFIVQIGGNSTTADLCSKIVPVLTVGTVFSALPTTKAQFRTLGRKLDDRDLQMLAIGGFGRENVIEGVFTSDLREQTVKYTRNDLNLPDGKFLIMLVGWRLNDEIDADFLRMMAKTFAENIRYVYIGFADKIKLMAENDETLAKHSIFLGPQTDLLAVAEVCDLYVNPRRTGGGMSCVEAMSKGVPAVTLPVGDVGINAGDTFAVSNYDEMAETIKRYHTDKRFYREMSEKARSRADALVDTDSEFAKIINAMLDSVIFE